MGVILNRHDVAYLRGASAAFKGNLDRIEQECNDAKAVRLVLLHDILKNLMPEEFEELKNRTEQGSGLIIDGQN